MGSLQNWNVEQNIGVRNSAEFHADTTVVAPHETGQIQRTVTSILGSVQFRSSRQCQDLLRYVIEQSLRDENDLLRERVIGAAVFGRKPDYDTANDPIVRARMGEVRKRLAQYYQSIEFDPSQTRIEIPPGHYRAVFRVAADRLPAPVEEEIPERIKQPAPAIVTAPAVQPEVSAPEPVEVRRSRRGLWAVGGVLLALCAVLVGVRVFSPARPTAFQQFWAPVLQNPMPVIIYTGTNVVYRFSPQFLDQYRKTHHLENNGPEFSVDLASLGSVQARDLQVSTNAYVTTGDVSACTSITSMLVQAKKPYELRFAEDISPGDLHSAPIVLMGAFNNPWTLNVTNSLRFRFSEGDTIKDAQDPKRFWKVKVNADGSTTDDYAVVSRLLNADHGQTIMTASGIGEYGTQAASDFLSNPDKINAFAKTLPADWNRKNLQIVMHVRVVDDVPVSQEVVATYQW